MIQIGGVYTTFCEKEGIFLLQKYRNRNGRRIAVLFESTGGRGRIDSPDFHCKYKRPSRFSTASKRDQTEFQPQAKQDQDNSP